MTQGQKGLLAVGVLIILAIVASMALGLVDSPHRCGGRECIRQVPTHSPSVAR